MPLNPHPTPNMNHLTHKTLIVSRGFTYSYYVASPKPPTNPTILLCHGWPDSATMWSNLSSALVTAGYGVVAPDCLGYGGTSKPVTPTGADYSSKTMADDVTEILDAEGISKVVSLGHDWGSMLAQRLWLFHPERVCGLAMLNVAYYTPAPAPYEHESFQAVLQQALGYPNFAYWRLFTADRGAEVIETHLDTMFNILHGGADVMMSTFCTEGGMEKWLLEDHPVKVLPYATESMRKEWVERIKRDGIGAPLQWYRGRVSSVHYEAEKEIPEEKWKVTVPAMFVGCPGDVVCRKEFIQDPVDKGLLPDLTVETIDSAHWLPFEKPEELAKVVTGWLKAKF